MQNVTIQTRMQWRWQSLVIMHGWSFKCRCYYQWNTGNNSVGSHKFKFHSRHWRAYESFWNFSKYYWWLEFKNIQLDLLAERKESSYKSHSRFSILIIRPMLRNWKKKLGSTNSLINRVNKLMPVSHMPKVQKHPSGLTGNWINNSEILLKS